MTGMESGNVASPPPGLDDDEAEAVRAAAQVIHLLLKGIKNIGIYRHAEARYEEYLAPAYQALGEFLADRSGLPLKLGPYSLEYKRHIIYEDEDKENLTYKFYKDGMRYLIFRPGITSDELLRFVLLAIESYSERALFQEDMVTRFWKEDFEFIDHVVVEGFGFGDLSEEEVEIEVEKIIGYLRRQLAAHSDDITRFARLSAQDLELELTEIEQVRGGIVSGRPATDEDRERLQTEILFEQKSRLFAKMVLILFQVLELEADQADRDILLESVVQLLDLLLVSEDIAGAVALLDRFERLRGRPMPSDRRAMIDQMRESFRQRMVEPQRLAQVGQYLQLSRNLDEDAVRMYLSVAGEEEVIPIVEMLSGMERLASRRLLIELLADIGRDHVELFARRLDHNSSGVVKDMLAIIHAIDPPNKIDLVARCLDHPNIMIRLEGLKTLAKSERPESLRYIEKALKDVDIQMRLGALRALAVRAPTRAAGLFIDTMQSSEFMQRDHRERVTVVTALGETRTPAAFDFLSGLFALKPGLFNRAKPHELKMLAVIGLHAMKTVPAFKVLAAEVQNRSHPRELLEACHKAATRLKDQLEKERRHA